MSQPIWNPGNVRPLRAVEDRTPRPDALGRDQAQSMEAMGAFAGSIAHLITNLLTAIGFETELALESLAPDHPARRRLREIEKIGERGAAVARQLLAFSGSQVLHPRAVDLNELVADSVDSLRRMVGDAIEVETTLAPDLPPVRVDPQQIEQVILNLASNARESMGEGGRLIVRTENVELTAADLVNPLRTAPGRYVLLSLSDTGPGLKEEVRRRIFEPFFSAEPGGEATGLGLATVYGIVTQSGGQISAEGEPGRGTTFRIYLPSAQEAQDGQEHTAGESWETILLVEDEDNVRKPLAQILTARGYAVLEAANADQAIEICQSHPGPIHLMITDILMGAVSGVELADQVAYRRPEMKVLFATGYPAGLADRPSLAGGDIPLLKKPFSGRTLAAKVREVLESRE
jgi:two-component system cell cycle sensor histidine kinase/response regulator CckA